MSKTVKRLFESFQPKHYQLHITPDRAAMHFRGTVTITGKRVGRPSQRFTFHQNGLKITQAAITKHDKKGDEQIVVSRINNQDTLQEVRLHADSLIYPGSYSITLDFEAPITRGMTGLYPCFFNHEGTERTLLATQFESHHAREVFPCIDEPEAKATFDLSLTHEADLVALGNTPIIAQDKNGVGLVTTTFETSPKMSSYLLAFVIGELHSKSGETKNGTQVHVWGTIAQPADSFDFALDAAIRTIEFFEDYFDTSYPLPKADHVALPDFSSGAMENWGLITYREAVLLSYPEARSQSTEETIALVIAHETSHQWFGNLVTMKWWDDLWLNESFANMMEYAAVDALYPDWQIWNNFVAAEGLSALRRDAVAGVQAVKTDVNHPDEISTLFDPSIVYAKGGRLLYMLKNYIGDDAWRTGLTAYFKKHAYGNTTGADLWAALSEASGKDIASFMNPWLERSGFPVVTVERKDNQTYVSQQHFLNNPDKADKDRLWPVPLFHDKTVKLLETASEAISQTSSDLRINQGARGHYIVRYTDKAQQTSLAKLVRSGELPIPDRLMLLNDSSMLAQAEHGSFAETLKLLEAYEDESAEAVWDIMALILAESRRFIDLDESIEPAVKQLSGKLSAKQFNRLGWQELEDESAADQKLRGTVIALGAYAETPEIVQHAIDLFEKYKAEQSVVSAELRGIIFAVAIKQRVAGALDYLLDLYKKTNNSDLQRDIASAVTATKNADDAERILGLLKDPKTIKPQDADRWFVMLLRNRHQRALAWQWMIDNWDWIEDIYAKDKSFDYFPRYCASVCATPEWAEKYRAFYEPKQDDIRLSRNITIGLEEIDSRVAWLQRDLPEVRRTLHAPPQA